MSGCQCRDGATAQIVMEQLCATLEASTSSSMHGPEQSKPSAASAASAASVRNPFESVARDALLLALRGVAFGGGSIGSEEASRFRRVSLPSKSSRTSVARNLPAFRSTREAVRVPAGALMIVAFGVVVVCRAKKQISSHGRHTMPIPSC